MIEIEIAAKFIDLAFKEDPSVRELLMFSINVISIGEVTLQCINTLSMLFVVVPCCDHTSPVALIDRRWNISSIVHVVQELLHCQLSWKLVLPTKVSPAATRLGMEKSVVPAAMTACPGPNPSQSSPDSAPTK